MTTYFNEAVYNFLKSNSQVYNFTYKVHFTILDYVDILNGVSDESVWLKSLSEHDNVDNFVQITCSV